jgi:hypothetical protein
MVAPKPGELLLLYITTTAEAVSMVLVAERLDTHNPHKLESSSANGSGFQDPKPAKEPKTKEAVGSQLPEVGPAHGDTGSQPPEATLGPHDQTVVGFWTSEVPPDLEDWELPEPTPIEIDASDPPPRRVRTIQRLVYYINEVLHEAKTRYLEVHMLLHAVVIASRKLRHYF